MEREKRSSDQFHKFEARNSQRQIAESNTAECRRCRTKFSFLEWTMCFFLLSIFFPQKLRETSSCVILHDDYEEVQSTIVRSFEHIYVPTHTSKWCKLWKLLINVVKIYMKIQELGLKRFTSLYSIQVFFLCYFATNRQMVFHVFILQVIITGWKIAAKIHFFNSS